MVSLAMGNAALTSAVNEDANPRPSYFLQFGADDAGNSVIKKRKTSRSFSTHRL